MKNKFALMMGIVATLALSSVAARADVRLPGLFTDGMVLQRDKPVRMWGWANEGERVVVSVAGKTAVAVARNGRFDVTLPPLVAGGPFVLTVTGHNALELHDVLVGEVWLASGQSNMGFQLATAQNGAQTIAAANDPQLRMFTVAIKTASAPQNDVAGGKWESATPQTAGQFSAVAYFFARALRQHLGVPVGIIHASSGGTYAEPWTSRPALEKWGLAPSEFDILTQSADELARQKAVYASQLAAWKAAGSPVTAFADPGIADFAQSWAAPSTSTADWKTLQMPALWETQNPALMIDGAVWLRREVEIPADWANRPLTLSLGVVDDYDTTYFNGVEIGATGAETSRAWLVKRRYTVPANLVKAGRATIAVRVWDGSGGGGILGPANAMRLAPGSGSSPKDARDLSGAWSFKVETSRPQNPGKEPTGLDRNSPSALYNGMIAPLIPYTMRGVIWYQGESNTWRAPAYRTLLPTLIADWRQRWAEGDFPFLLVQLAPYGAVTATPQPSNWAVVREAQALAAQTLPNVGMAVITDVGDEKNIHPTRKEPVGERLALQARRIAYGESIIADGPTLKALEVRGKQAIISFEHLGGGLEMRGDKLTGFSIQGENGAWLWADAKIEGDKVVVSSPQVAHPVAVRFGWADTPVVNLWNKAGLPAVPFRTDVPGETEN